MDKELEVIVANELAKFFKDPIDKECSYCEASKAVIPIIQKARDNYYKEWLDDIFLCEFYDAPKRDELCRELWQTLKGGIK